MIFLFFACTRGSQIVEPLPEAYHRQMEAEARALVPDPVRAGPPIAEGSSPLPPFTGVNRGTDHYVGAEACAPCHPQAVAVWAETAHHRALDVLQLHNSAFNPACLRCHVTGFGHPSGWSGTANRQLRDVQCEACHGPGSTHVASPAPGYGVLPRSGAACVGCHTWENSPEYRFDDYWPKIAHGPG